ncbi:hypothetical protein SAMN04487996_10198 [Dyadobacter soli]|uniref:Uncharacterized protein n=1 Tax=Dyadobacter soli TaxID=659014 RepID=A0A1G6UZV3_9BACT|nr:hypothetical protein [Dyadobacter soli]SDD46784.1 hypothetical protein SAMN04487996_10198 [Dyadobacter soli]
MKTPSTNPSADTVIRIERFLNAEGKPHAVLSYNASKNYLLMKWIGYSADPEIITALDGMKNWYQSNGKARKCRFHVHDTKEVEGSWAGALAYICDDFFPACHQAGLSCNLSIISPDFFSKMASVTLFNQHGAAVPTVLVNTLREAESFIAERQSVGN